jgi:hypothetical protein
MFETNDLMEKTQWQKYLLCFAAGCLVATLISYVFVTPVVKRVAARSAEKAALQKFNAELEKNPVQAQLESTKAALQTAAQERDACKTQFDRQTILYDNSIAVDPEKIWIIPAYVEPIVVGDHAVTYTHYDPKARRETVRFYPKRQ